MKSASQLEIKTSPKNDVVLLMSLKGPGYDFASRNSWCDLLKNPTEARRNFEEKKLTTAWLKSVTISQGIVGCTPIPTWDPDGKPLYKPYTTSVFVGCNPQESHGYTVRGTHNCPLNILTYDTLHLAPST